MRKFEQYQDMIGRLYPELKDTSDISKNKTISRTVTFQVTDKCNLACFPKDTVITMADASKKMIQDIVVGDMIMGFDEITSHDKILEFKPTEVTAMSVTTGELMTIFLSDNVTITCTPDHLFILENRKWRRADELTTEDCLLYITNDNCNDYASLKVIDILQSDRENESVVYNIQTESHTYIANNICTHNCTYCYQINKGVRRMKFEHAKKLIDMLLTGDERLGGYIDAKSSPAIIIEFIGGEPFLEVDLIEKICDYFYDRAIELMHPWATLFCISICSNGVLYTDKRVQRFLNKYRNKLSFSVTIDGNKELHDACRVFPDGSPSYDLAVHAANDWMKRGYYMGSKITIAPGNLEYMYNAIVHMVELGYDDINANTVYEKGWTIDHAKLYFKELVRVADYWNDNDLVDTHYLALFQVSMFKPKLSTDLNNWCGGTGNMLAMDPDGYLYPCIRYMESSLGTDVEPLRIGHVDIGIAQTECHKNCVDCLNAIDRRTQSDDECFYCPIAEGCSWCSAYNYQENGTPDMRVKYSCDMHKARALANVYFWNTYYRKRNMGDRFKMHCPKEWALEIIDEETYNLLKDLSSEDN